MSARRIVRGTQTAILCAMLGGCFNSSDEPFALADGDTPHLTPGPLICFGKDEGPDKGERKQFAKLTHGGEVQYVLVGESDLSVQPFSFYQVKGDRYVVASAKEGSAGATIYIADITDSSVQIFDDSVEAMQSQVLKIAEKHGVEVKVNAPIWEITGPLKAQREFLIDVAFEWPSTADAALKCVRPESPDTEAGSAQ